MAYDVATANLEAEWAEEDGFFWQVRQGRFEPDAYRRALDLLRGIRIDDTPTVPRRLVSLLWYIPLFLHWQTERVQESGGDSTSYTSIVATMTNEVERILGVP